MLTASASLLGAEGPFRVDAPLSDRDIRLALANQFLWNGTVLEEVRCWRGHVRADYVVASSDSLIVIEIKSDRDTLTRLDEQVRVYSAIADRVVLVVGWSLAARALRAVPSWWEVWLAEQPPEGEMCFVPLRDGATNPSLDTLGLASMLPVEEARQVAIRAGLPAARARGSDLRQLLSLNVAVEVLRSAVHDWLRRLGDRRTAQVA